MQKTNPQTSTWQVATPNRGSSNCHSHKKLLQGARPYQFLTPLIGFILPATPFIRPIYKGPMSLHVLTILGAGYPTLNVGPGWLGSLSTSFRKKPWETWRNNDFVEKKWKKKKWKNSSNTKGEGLLLVCGFLRWIRKKQIDIYIYIHSISLSFFRSKKWALPKAISYSCPLFAGPSLGRNKCRFLGFFLKGIFREEEGNRSLLRWWQPAWLHRSLRKNSLNQRFSVIPTHWETL